MDSDYEYDDGFDYQEALEEFEQNRRYREIAYENECAGFPTKSPEEEEEDRQYILTGALRPCDLEELEDYSDDDEHQVDYADDNGRNENQGGYFDRDNDGEYDECEYEGHEEDYIGNYDNNNGEYEDEVYENEVDENEVDENEVDEDEVDEDEVDENEVDEDEAYEDNY